MQFIIAIEPATDATCFGVVVPDLPGCVAAASSREAVLHEIRAAIQFHLEGLDSDGFVAPASSSSVEMVRV